MFRLGKWVLLATSGKGNKAGSLLTNTSAIPREEEEEEGGGVKWCQTIASTKGRKCSDIGCLFQGQCLSVFSAEYRIGAHHNEGTALIPSSSASHTIATLLRLSTGVKAAFSAEYRIGAHHNEDTALIPSISASHTIATLLRLCTGVKAASVARAYHSNIDTNPGSGDYSSNDSNPGSGDYSSSNTKPGSGDYRSINTKPGSGDVPAPKQAFLDKVCNRPFRFVGRAPPIRPSCEVPWGSPLLDWHYVQHRNVPPFGLLESWNLTHVQVASSLGERTTARKVPCS
jgi:hypothetical protein